MPDKIARSRRCALVALALLMLAPPSAAAGEPASETCAIHVAEAAFELEALQGDCFSGESDPEQARRRNVTLGCKLLEVDEAIAAVELAYGEEVLASTAELRRRELATAQELISARFTVDRAQTKLRSRAARLRDCSDGAAK